MTHHLEDVGDWIIDVAMFAAFEVLNSHNDDHVARNREAPRSFLGRESTAGSCLAQAKNPPEKQ